MNAVGFAVRSFVYLIAIVLGFYCSGGMPSRRVPLPPSMPATVVHTIQRSPCPYGAVALGRWSEDYICEKTRRSR
jgi:hypothetical protein